MYKERTQTLYISTVPMALLALLVLLSGLIAGQGTYAIKKVENGIFVEKEILDLITDQRRQTDQMKKLVVNVEKLNNGLKDEVLELKRDNDVINARLKTLQKQVSANEERNLHLQQKLEIVTKKLILVSSSKQASQTIWQTHDSDTAQGKPNNRTKSNSSIRHGYNPKGVSKGSLGLSHNIQARQITGTVAFSTWVKTDIEFLTKGDVIKYDGIMVNDGNAYDAATGYFTVPRDGLYIFSFFVEDYTDQDLWVTLREDNGIRSQAVAEPYAASQNIMGGNVVLLHCTAGSRIWIAIEKGNRVQNNWSTFSGVLLH